MNRDGTQFEIVCDRQRNNYETSLNSFGNIFTSDNDDDGNRGCRVIWAMDGGHYGYHTPGSPRHWGEEVPGNVPKLVGTGNGSPCGIMVYEGELLPPEYRGAVFEVDAGTRQVNLFPLSAREPRFAPRAKCSYPAMIHGSGRSMPAQRPMGRCSSRIGTTQGSAGMPSATRRRVRIYRVAPAGHKNHKVKVDMGTSEGLIAALRSPNIATQDAARRGIDRPRQARAGSECRSSAGRFGAFRMGGALEDGRGRQQGRGTRSCLLDAPGNYAGH